jgi:ribosomal protein S18 acetylase RimI-like enzyme
MSWRAQIEKYRRDWSSFPSDAALGYRAEGVRGVWSALAERSVYRVFRMGRLTVYAQPLGNIPVLPPPPGIRVAAIRDEEWPVFSSLVSQRNLSRFRARAQAGCHCLVAWRGSTPLGYAWVAEQITPLVSEVPPPLPPDAAYLWDLFVIPGERGNGIGSALAHARLHTAQALGFREGWRMISPSNTASIRTLDKSGSEALVIGELRYLKVVTRLRVRFIPAPDHPVPIRNREGRP